MIRPLAAVILAASSCGLTGPPPASRDDRPGVVMGTKDAGGLVLMVGIPNQARAYERSVTTEQAEACTRRPVQEYPACLP